MKYTRLGAMLGVLVVLAALSATSASGTFAGANGRIAFTMRAETEREPDRAAPDTDSPLQEALPVWAPDGTLIAIATCDFTGGTQGNCVIQMMKPDCTDLTTIPIQGALFRVGGRIDWQPLPRG